MVDTKRALSFIPSFNTSTLTSLHNPFIWEAMLSIVLFAYILVGNQNEHLFLSIFSLSGSNSLLDSCMKFCAADLIFILTLAAGLWYIFTQKGKYVPIAISFLGIGLITFVLSRLTGRIIIDIRPYIEYHLTPLVTVARDNGFPSDHTLLAALTTSVVALYAKKTGWILFILTLLVAFGRVYTAAHHPLDVVGSMGIIVVSTILFVLGTNLVYSFLKEKNG